jgi:hypothetical protein
MLLSVSAHSNDTTHCLRLKLHHLEKVVEFQLPPIQNEPQNKYFRYSRNNHAKYLTCL